MEIIRKSLVILNKDLKSELRNRYVINSLLMFVIVTISIIKFSIGSETIGVTVLAGLLWIVIFFSASSGLARVFIKEEEKETSMSLKLASSSTEILIGKWAFNFILTFGLNFVVVLLFIMITEFKIINTFEFVILLLLGNLGIVSASTIIAAIISKANAKGTLYPVLAFPILLPLFMTVVNSTKLAVEGSTIEEFLPDFQILISYSVVVFTASLMLFRFIWED